MRIPHFGGEMDTIDNIEAEIEDEIYASGVTLRKSV